MSSGLRPVSASIRKVASTATAKRMVVLGQLLQSWEDVVGPELAAVCQPHALKVISKGEYKQATLQIAADPVHATALHYQQPLILARISRLLGHGFIQDVRVVPRHIAPREKAAARTAKRPFPLTESQNQRLSQALENVSDPELQAQLDRLGRAIFTRSPAADSESPDKSQ